MIYPKLLVGNFLKKLGWDLRPAWKVPICSADLVGIGIGLIRALKRSEPIRVIQIGAFDGTTSDPLRVFLDAKDIQACLLEPQQEPFNKLALLYQNFPSVTTLQMALADHDGFIKMTTDEIDGSAMASIISGHNQRFGIRKKSLKEISVPCITAQSLLDRCGWPQIDFLQVDVEGYDWEAVKFFLKISPKPQVINFELLHLDRKTRSESAMVLDKMGYQFIDNKFDRFALHCDLLK